MINNKIIISLLAVGMGHCYAQQRPNIVIMIADDSSHDDWGCYGNADSKTPNIDAFAKESLKFNNCFQAVAMSSPTRHCLYTGVYPVKSGAYPNHTFVNDTIKSFVQYFQPEGYAVALAGKTHVAPKSVFSFEYLGDYKDSPGGDFQWNRVDKFLTRNLKKPFFLVMASHESHAPYVNGDASRWNPAKLKLPPMYVDTPEFREEYTKYLAEIAVFDTQVKKMCDLLKAKQLEENTIFILLSEQGNGFPFAKWTCYKQGLQSAMLVRWPHNVKPGTETNALVEYVDVIPTLLDIIGYRQPTQCDGKSFYSVLRGKKRKHKKCVYGIQTTRGIIHGSDHYGCRSARNDRYSYILNLTPEVEFKNIVTEGEDVWWKSWVKKSKNDTFASQQIHKYQNRPKEELYDVKNDPYELVNLADNPEYRKVKEQLRTNLLNWMDEQGDKGQQTELEATEHLMKKK